MVCCAEMAVQTLITGQNNVDNNVTAGTEIKVRKE